MSSSITSFEVTSAGPATSAQATSTSQPLFASSSGSFNASASTSIPASETRRTVTESQSVYINTSYVYSPTISSPSSTAILPTNSNTASSSQQTSSSTRLRPSVPTSPIAPTATPIVPSAGQPLLQGNNGLILNLTLAGDDVGQAVYSVPMVFGHPSGSQYYETNAGLFNADDEWKRGDHDAGMGRSGKTKVFGPRNSGKLQSTGLRARQRSDSGLRGKRAPGTYQSMNLQVDLGSSDLWVAATTCQTSDCRGSGVQKLNAGRSIDAGNYVNLTFQSGHAAGEVYWDEVQLGVSVATIESALNGTGGGGSNGFDVAYQAFVAANDVGNEDLSGGQFSGVLGLALPGNSVILNQLGGSTSGEPDGAPYLDNLFGSGVNAPQGRYFTLSLERVGDSRTKSSLGIGMFDDTLCPVPCIPNYSSIVTSSVGPLYWRIPLQGITAYTWPSGQVPLANTSTTTTIKLPSSSTTGQSYPVAVMDSGGYQVLMGDQSLVDSIYDVFGGSQGSDGNYYLRCDMPLSLAFTFNGKQYPAHPLDMSDYSPTDTSHKTCVGMIQYASGLTAGDVILGAAYLKNVYSIYTYPSSSESTSSWLPMVGQLSLTNATEAAQEFYDVRVQHSSYPGQVSSVGTAPSQSPDAAADHAGHQVLSGGIIALAVVLGFVGFAAALFCAWFFWLRKKYGTKGVPAFASHRKGGMGSVNGTDGSIGTDNFELTGAAGLGRRSKKYRNMQRQKSMIDGFMDFDTDLWSDDVDSKTDADTTTSKSMDGSGVAVLGEELSRGRRTSSKAWESSYPPAGWASHQRAPSSQYGRECSPPAPTSPLSTTGALSRSSQRFADADEGPYPTFSSIGNHQVMSPTQDPLMTLPETPVRETLGRQTSNNAGYFDSPESRRSQWDMSRSLASRGSILRIHDPTQSSGKE
ncbi:hypothetical protein NliqN6_2708 [Naganishia liquefaciens]|uniref:Peptidase A1 domain-containing protein n=1 Tax=Naganishia liquefaciens TaxID=104408 RepID=A0A8H3YG20_9TREE|nr:hypothetical protein NliqN6_2708 [Naganishia liquefaciens]